MLPEAMLPEAMLTVMAGGGLLAVLAVLAAWDLRYGQLPDLLTLPLLLTGVALAAVVGSPVTLRDSLTGSAAGYLGLAGVAWGYRQWAQRPGLGGGDIKLLAAIGAWTGWSPLPEVVALAAATTLLVAVAQARWQGRTLSRAQALPFGPGLAAAGGMVWIDRLDSAHGLWPTLEPGALFFPGG